MMKLYRMPDGIVRRYEEGQAPECASLLVPEVKAKAEPKIEPEEKAIEETENKAVKPANKAKKGSKKK